MPVTITQQYRVRYHQISGKPKISYYDTLAEAIAAADNTGNDCTGSEVEDYVDGIGWVMNLESEE